MADPLPQRARRRAWRTWYGLRWRLWQQRQADRVRERSIRGLRVTVQPGVLDPAWFFSSEVLIDALAQEVRAGDTVLDLGTGTGIGALAALRAGAARVVATDLDPAAAACARANLASADPARVEVRDGDLFGPVADERYDVVAFNPPWLIQGDEQHRAALRVSPDLPGRFAAGLAGHLGPDGRALLVLSTTADGATWLEPLQTAGFAAAAAVVRDRGSEVLTAWRLTRRAG